jgi:hypothetical protein
MMQKYLVEVWTDGKAGDWQEITAGSEHEAAERVIGIQLKASGMPGELRAHVRLAGDIRTGVATRFYASPK